MRYFVCFAANCGIWWGGWRRRRSRFLSFSNWETKEEITEVWLHLWNSLISPFLSTKLNGRGMHNLEHLDRKKQKEKHSRTEQNENQEILPMFIAPRILEWNSFYFSRLSNVIWGERRNLSFPYSNIAEKFMWFCFRTENWINLNGRKWRHKVAIRNVKRRRRGRGNEILHLTARKS